MENDTNQDEQADRPKQIVGRVRNHPIVAGLIAIGLILLATLTFTNTFIEQWSKFTAHFHHSAQKSTPSTETRSAPISQQATDSDCSNIAAGGNVNVQCPPSEKDRDKTKPLAKP